MTVPIPASAPPARRAALWLADHPHTDITIHSIGTVATLTLYAPAMSIHDARAAAAALGLDPDDYTDQGGGSRDWTDQAGGLTVTWQRITIWSSDADTQP